MTPRGPDYVTRPSFRVAGLGIDCSIEKRGEIPGLWARFAPQIDTVAHRVGADTFGLCIPTDPDTMAFRYVAGVAVDGDAGDAFETHEVPAAEYAVFTHVGPLDGLPATVDYIFGDWLPAHAARAPGVPDFERYDDRFDPARGDGEFEIWVPLAR